jgi:hypothetical protein
MAESGSWKKITIHTDGGCDGNPGPGGWAALPRYGIHVRELAGGEPATTNNRMELQAAIAGLMWRFGATIHRKSLPPCVKPLLPAVTQTEINAVCSDARETLNLLASLGRVSL